MIQVFFLSLRIFANQKMCATRVKWSLNDAPRKSELNMNITVFSVVDRPGQSYAIYKKSGVPRTRFRAPQATLESPHLHPRSGRTRRTNRFFPWKMEAKNGLRGDQEPGRIQPVQTCFVIGVCVQYRIRV